MGWSPSGSSDASYRQWVGLLVGVLLLTNPLVVGVTDVGDPDRYRYEASEVASPDGTIDVPAGVDVREPEILCLQTPPTRACMVERAIVERDGITYDGLPRRVLTADYAYVYDEVDGTDRFYRVTTNETATGEINYSHERVANQRVLRSVATPLQRASRGVRTAIEGSYVTSDPLEEAETLVRTDQGYYVVHATEVHETSGERRVVVRALQWIAGALGVLLIYRSGVRAGRRG
jgi:hypothetical protein